MTRTKTTFDNARGNFVNSHPAPGFYTYLRTANENNCTLRNMERLSNSHGRTHTFTNLRAHNWTHKALFEEEREGAGGESPHPLFYHRQTVCLYADALLSQAVRVMIMHCYTGSYGRRGRTLLRAPNLSVCAQHNNGFKERCDGMLENVLLQFGVS